MNACSEVKKLCARAVDILYSSVAGRIDGASVEMELQHMDIATRSNELERMTDNAKRASDFLKALAHESRLMMLCILAEREKSVSELEQELGLRQPTVSQQLARLRADGLVATRRDGKTIYYSVASDEARTIIGAIYDVFCRKARKR